MGLIIYNEEKTLIGSYLWKFNMKLPTSGEGFAAVIRAMYGRKTKTERRRVDKIHPSLKKPLPNQPANSLNAQSIIRVSSPDSNSP